MLELKVVLDVKTSVELAQQLATRRITSSSQLGRRRQLRPRSGPTPSSFSSATACTSSSATPTGSSRCCAGRSRRSARSSRPTARPTLTVRAMDALVVAEGNSKPPEAEVTYEQRRTGRSPSDRPAPQRLGFEDDDDGPGAPRSSSSATSTTCAFLKERARADRLRRLHAHRPEDGQDVAALRQADATGASAEPSAPTCWPGARCANATPDVTPSMIEFKPTITAAEQVQSVTVRGWDVRRARRRSRHTATPPRRRRGVSGEPARRPARRPATPRSAGREGPGKEGRRRRAGGATQRKEAAASPRGGACSPICSAPTSSSPATGKAIGLPDLRPGDNVEIRGVGARFSGTYFVTKATHTLNATRPADRVRRAQDATRGSA